MNYVGKLVSGVTGFYKEINAATLTGAIDVIVVQKEDGDFVSSPFHVRFGKMGVLHSKEKLVDIIINDELVTLPMKLGESGEAFFVEEADDSEIPSHLATSPLLISAEELMDLGLKELHEHNIASTKETEETEETNITDELPDCTTTIDFNSTESINIVTSNVSIDENLLSDKVPVAGSDSDDEGLKELASDERKKRCRRRSKKERNHSNSVKKDIDAFPNRQISAHSNDNSVTQCSTLDLRGNSVDPDMEETIFEMDVSDNDSRFSPPMMRRVQHQAKLTRPANNINDSDSVFRPIKDFYPFSDGEVSPVGSPKTARPPSPKSDTEIDNIQRQENQTSEQIQVPGELKWTWGEVPTKDESKAYQTIDEPNDEPGKGFNQVTTSHQQSVLTSMFRFMKSTKKLRHQHSTEGGIYLEDLKHLDEHDPKVAALYHPRSHLQQSTESLPTCAGNVIEEQSSDLGASVSPSSARGSIIENVDHHTYDQSEHVQFRDIAMSLCGLPPDDLSMEEYDKLFNDNVITYTNFNDHPEHLTNPNIVIRIDNKLYTWKVAAPILAAISIYNRPLDNGTIDTLVKQHMPTKKEAKTEKRRLSSWFYWGRTQEPIQASVAKLDIPVSDVSSLPELTDIPIESDERDTDAVISLENHDPVRSVSAPMMVPIVHDEPSRLITTSCRSYKKSLHLKSDQLKSLKLKEGANDVSFSVTTKYQGTSRCEARIFLWRHDDKIVISDIDGTITKSDVFGQILPVIGKDWTQSGVVDLFTSVSKNGYQFLYLSARAIGQAPITRTFLRNIRQGGLHLPEGPLLLSPSSMMSAFHREVIEKKPEEFKIQCLRDIQHLFPGQRSNPFHSGYGNRVNDVWAYRAVGIPISRIFTINPKGELKHELNETFQSSYAKLSDMVDHLFPPIHHTDEGKTTAFSVPDQYSTFTYWRDPPLDISKDLSQLSMEQ